jgi:lipopolysaccharide/colanic/teichoic acid biosynthesis glycosyltransferase
MIIKFRTLSNIPHIDNTLQSATSIGNALRKSSLDEIPQLWNVLKGDMSLVGPRPLLPEYLSVYNAEQRRRHAVLPGITGWAQINGRNAISWEKKFAFDIWYVENRSIRLDFKILYLTLLKTVKRPGEHVLPAFEKFRGTL